MSEAFAANCFEALRVDDEQPALFYPDLRDVRWRSYRDLADQAAVGAVRLLECFEPKAGADGVVPGKVGFAADRSAESVAAAWAIRSAGLSAYAFPVRFEPPEPPLLEPLSDENLALDAWLEWADSPVPSADDPSAVGKLSQVTKVVLPPAVKIWQRQEPRPQWPIVSEAPSNPTQAANEAATEGGVWAWPGSPEAEAQPRSRHWLENSEIFALSPDASKSTWHLRHLRQRLLEPGSMPRNCSADSGVVVGVICWLWFLISNRRRRRLL